ncbi:MAG: DUF6753 family protein [Xenococcaceae cyanobacterium]
MFNQMPGKPFPEAKDELEKELEAVELPEEWLAQLEDDPNESESGLAKSFFPSTPENERVNQSLINEVLKGKDANYRSHVLRVAYEAEIEKNDPLFAVLLATGQLELLLDKKPAEIEQCFQKWRSLWQSDLQDAQAIFSQELEQVRSLTDNWEEESKAFLERQGKAAVNIQQRCIAKSVQDLVRGAAFEKVAHDANALVCAGLVLLGAIGIGVVLGLAIPKFAKAPELDPTGPRQLSLEEAKALDWGLSKAGQFARANPELIQWARSREGQFARKFMQWNQTLLSGKKGQRVCEREHKRLGVTLTLEGKAAKSGVCTLWVKPPHEREFVEGTH